MSNLSNQYISSSYQSVLNIGTISGSSLSGTLQPVTDGFGQQTPISISSTKVGINGDLLMTGSIIPQGSGSFDLGSPTNPFRHGYFSSGSIYLDDHQVLTLVDAATNTALKAPAGGTLNLLNNIVFASDTTDGIGGTLTMQGAGPNNQTGTIYTGSFHFISNDGYLAWVNKVDGSTTTGSYAFNLVDGGGFAIENHNGANTIRSVESGGSALVFSKDNNLNNDKLILVGSGPLTIENTTDAQPISIHNNNGPIYLDAFKFISGAFVEANNINMYGDTIVIDANYISSSAAFAGDTSFSGSITLSGTLYPGQIDVSQGNISENTGSYIATFLNNGIMTYDTYQNVATGLSSYLSGSMGTSGSSGTSGSNGSNGTDGTSGSNGTDGTSGSNGTDGTSGSNGTDGTSGTSGSDGTSGTSGSDGTSGTSGSDGTSGTSGSDGTSGTSPSVVGFITTGSITDTQSISGSLIVTGSSKIIGNQSIEGNIYTNIAGNSVILVSQNCVSDLPSGSNNTIIGNPGPLNGALDNTLIIGVNGGKVLQGSPSTISLLRNTEITGSLTVTNNIIGSLQGTASFATNFNKTELATTGSNIFNGNQTITGSLTDFGGNLYIVQSGQTQPFRITGSQAGGNIIMGYANDTAVPQSDATGSWSITGSNNIIMNGLIPDENFAFDPGFKAYLSGSNNILFGLPSAQNGILVHSSSVMLPTMNSNILGGYVNLGFTSSSLAKPTFSSNIGAGQFVFFHQSGSLSAFNNLNIGGITSTANKTTLGLATSISTNILGPVQAVLNHNSSSIQYSNNIGGLTVNNNYSSSVSTAVNNITVSTNQFHGATNSLTVSGSNSGTRRTFNSNVIIGRNIEVNSIHSTGTGGHLIGTSILGQNLIVSASHTSNSVGGSTFVGRFNATGSLQESSQDTVFVVGTGTAAGSRRNALRIDSNNNSNFTGSVFISGSLNSNGNTIITGSLRVSGDVMFASGSNTTMGTVVLDGGNPGVATVSNSLVTTSSLIFLTKQTNTNSGEGTVSVTSKGTGTFSITSNHNGDADTVAYQIINPA